MKVQHLYSEIYPDWNHPLACTFENICWKLLETGSWNSKTHEHSKPVTNKANEVAVLAAVANYLKNCVEFVSLHFISCKTIILSFETFCLLMKLLFTNHGQINMRNMHYWFVKNPQWLGKFIINGNEEWTCGVAPMVIISLDCTLLKYHYQAVDMQLFIWDSASPERFTIANLSVSVVPTWCLSYTLHTSSKDK
jgi:hypothetical protein